MSSSCCEQGCDAPNTDLRYRPILWVSLVINVLMFLVEITASFIGGSMSLRADALDFLADSLNYAIALAVIGLSLRWRAGAALVKGGIMALFGLWVAHSIVSNAIIGALPEAKVIGSVGLLALAGNVSVATLLYRHRANDSQAMSVWLCTRNDCISASTGASTRSTHSGHCWESAGVRSARRMRACIRANSSEKAKGFVR